MKDFKGGARKPSAFGGKRDFGSRGGFGKPQRSGFGGSRDKERPTMYKAICSDCSSSCEVPFRPNGTKPVLCSACFSVSKGGERSFSDRGPRDFNRSERAPREFDRSERQLFKATCEDCGAPCEVPFRPSAGKPVFCDACFHGSDSVHKPAKAKDASQDQLSVLNAKLDQILNLLKANDAFVGKLEKAEVKAATIVVPVISSTKKPIKVKELKTEKSLKKEKKEVKTKTVKAKTIKPKTIKKKS